jgi:hypothetical protein
VGVGQVYAYMEGKHDTEDEEWEGSNGRKNPENKAMT